MADMFMVLDILKCSSEVMDYATVCLTYPQANLLLLKEGCVSIVSIYNNGNRVAVINRIKEAQA